jgi:hypothetical protein
MGQLACRIPREIEGIIEGKGTQPDNAGHKTPELHSIPSQKHFTAQAQGFPRPRGCLPVDNDQVMYTLNHIYAQAYLSGLKGF